jgi:ribosome biogenesis protein Nip4
MSQFVYTTLAGKKLNLEELNAKEKKLVRKLLKKYQRNSPYHCFVNEVNRDLLLDLMQGEKVFYFHNVILRLQWSDASDH